MRETIVTLEDKLSEAEERAETAKRELDEIRQEYSLQPKSAALSVKFGEANQRYISLKRDAVPKVVRVRPGPPVRSLSNVEFGDAIEKKYPGGCPACGLRVPGYYVRLGGPKWQHRSPGGYRNPCSYEGSVDG